jgi:hypothetical protein
MEVRTLSGRSGVHLVGIVSLWVGQLTQRLEVRWGQRSAKARCCVRPRGALVIGAEQKNLAKEARVTDYSCDEPMFW